MEIWYTEFGIELRSEADKLRDKYRGRIRLVMKYIRQYDEMTCGVTCIANILIHYGEENVDISKLIEISKTDKNGANLYGIAETLEILGFQAKVLKGSSEEFFKAVRDNEILLPCIIHTNSENNVMHYVIVREVKSNKVSIHDPAKGNISISYEEFNDLFTGYVVNIKNPENRKKAFSRTSVRKQSSFMELMPQNKWAIISTVLFSLVIAGIGILGTGIFELIIDRPGEVNLKMIMIALAVLYLFQACVQIGRTLIMSKMSRRIDNVLHKKYNEAITYLSSEKLRIRTTGDYLARFNELTTVRDAVSSVVLVMFVDGIIILGSGVTLWRMNSKLFLANVIIMLIYVGVMFIFRGPISRSNNEVMESSSEAQGYVKECIDGEETIKTLNVKNYIFAKQTAKSDKLTGSFYTAGMIEQIQETIVSAIDSMGLLIVLGMGILYVGIGVMTIGEVITFYSLSAYFSNPLKNIANLQPILQEGKIAQKRLDDIIGLSKEAADGVPFEEKINKIELKNIDFRYGNGKKILDHVSISIQGTQRIALVGESGSGKSTITKILEGLYTPESGEILINGKNLQEYSLESYRSKVGVVSQDNFLFSDTIRNNLLLGRDITEEQMIEACKKCNIHEMIEELPFGYDTVLEEGGKNLSGGQRQRLCIARAILGKPEFLIMDESTSSLDRHSERIIIQLIEDLQLPCLMVTHRKNVLKSCEYVYFLKKGIVAGEGTYEELMETNEEFSKVI